MVRIPFKPKEYTLQTSLIDDSSSLIIDMRSQSAQIQAVLALYNALVERLMKLGACLLDKREEEVSSRKEECIALLTMLDEGVSLEGELAENMHILYRHCIRRLQASNPLEIDTVDAVRMVVVRLRHVYWRVAENESSVKRES